MKSPSSREGELGELTDPRSFWHISNYYEKLHANYIFAHTCFSSALAGVYGGQSTLTAPILVMSGQYHLGKAKHH